MKIRMEAQEIDVPDEFAVDLLAWPERHVVIRLDHETNLALGYRLEIPVRLTPVTGDVDVPSRR